mmetsp:Transcript_11706/g.15285  ORF Transcript_11706/g.15285 Transcript_11706/m.15285 type:complete len:80 (+) Transcript_11706:826-1065(+)
MLPHFKVNEKILREAIGSKAGDLAGLLVAYRNLINRDEDLCFGEDFENMRAVTTMLLCCHKTILEFVIKSTLLFDKVDV